MLYVRGGLANDLNISLGRVDWCVLRCPQCKDYLTPCVVNGDEPGLGCIECTLVFDLCEIEAKLEGK